MRKLLNRYGLAKLPFERDVPLDEFFDTDGFVAARRLVKAAIEGRSSAVLTGESGTGKTFVARAVEADLVQGRYNVTYIHNSTVNRRDFYRQVATALGLEPRATPAALFQIVSAHIEALASEHQIRPLLILDEAHLLPVQVLGHLHILLNFQRDSKPYLSLVLVGLPELRDVLRRHNLASLAARLPMRVHLAPLPPEEVHEYVRHRLKLAGRTQDLFSEDALLLIAEATGGIARRIDVLAQRALLEALDQKSTLIDASVVRRAVEHCAEALA